MTVIPAEILRGIQLLTGYIERAHQRNLKGFYLYGSLSLHAYRENLSDVDFLGVTDRVLTGDEVKRVEEAFYTFSTMEPLASTFEGNFIPMHSLQLHMGENCPQCYEGKFFYAPPRDWNAVTIYTLYHHGITVFGPSPKQLLPKIQISDVMKNMLGNLLFLQKRMPYYVANGLSYQVFGVLTLCRIFYTVKTGSITSKREAALYAATHMETPWRDLVCKAIIYWNVRDDHGLQVDTQENLLAFVEYVKSITEEKLSVYVEK